MSTSVEKTIAGIKRMLSGEPDYYADAEIVWNMLSRAQQKFIFKGLGITTDNNTWRTLSERQRATILRLIEDFAGISASAIAALEEHRRQVFEQHQARVAA